MCETMLYFCFSRDLGYDSLTTLHCMSYLNYHRCFPSHLVFRTHPDKRKTLPQKYGGVTVAYNS